MADIAVPAGFASRKLQDLPAVRQLMAIAGIALAIAAGITLFFWAQKPNQAPLYPNLGEKDSAEVADALRAAGIEFKLDGASGSVTVPADKVHEARLRLASQGLPKGSSLGMEMIREEQGFGTSQFIETARYQLALETELSRTIGSLMSVKSSRVHLALPKPSAFARSRDQASASVLLELHPGRQLEAGQVASIVHMVASSVPNLQPSAVTVIDQYGHLLTGDGNNSEADASSEQFSFARRVEADYVRRIEQLLAPMMGAGRVSAQVSADVDFSVTEEAREAYNPNPQAIRSEQTSEEATRNGAGAAA
uniref:flagellar basal-body MS-ring/collar protein FliF n=1 Tax=Nevskia sp. TaxID=1929292 RepID=UPI0025D49DB3